MIRMVVFTSTIQKEGSGYIWLSDCCRLQELYIRLELVLRISNRNRGHRRKLQRHDSIVKILYANPNKFLCYFLFYLWIIIFVII
ncbi:hypothetical protein LINGRAHAP2_LOCUS26996 [Linum grandiflorum]